MSGSNNDWDNSAMERFSPLCGVGTSPCAGSACHDLLVQFLIHDLHRAVDLGIGHAQLM
jgi:hypothetical protein